MEASPIGMPRHDNRSSAVGRIASPASVSGVRRYHRRYLLDKHFFGRRGRCQLLDTGLVRQLSRSATGARMGGWDRGLFGIR